MFDRSLNRKGTGLAPGHVPDGRRVLDLAEGILVGLHRYSAEAAFCDLVAVAHRHDITVSAAASALVALASGDADAACLHPVEVAIAQVEWGGLLPAIPAPNGRQV